MATTSDVTYLGALTNLVLIEANDFAEAAADWHGLAFSRAGDPLRNDTRANDFKTRKNATVPEPQMQCSQRARRSVRYVETALTTHSVPTAIGILPKARSGANSGHGAS